VQELTITIPAIPTAQPRQRTRIAGMAGKQFVQNYTPSKSPIADFKAAVKMAARQVYVAAPINGPLVVSVAFVFPRPKSKPDWIKKENIWFWPWKGGHRVPHISKPDRDNLDKAVLDALKGITFGDDKQACSGVIRKWIAAADEQPHVAVTIRPLQPEAA
jgi:Holliday junction resolvase RusA-like endonuclease